MPAIVKPVVQILILAGLTALILLLLVRFGVLEPAIRWTLGSDNVLDRVQRHNCICAKQDGDLLYPSLPADQRWWGVGKQHTSMQLRLSLRNRITEQAASELLKFKDYQKTSDFSIYDRPPPAGFQEWVGFAMEKGCVLEKYDRIEEDLRPFRESGITAAMVQEAALLEHVALFQIRNGQVTCEQAASDPAAATYLRVSDTITNRFFLSTLTDAELTQICA